MYRNGIIIFLVGVVVALAGMVVIDGSGAVEPAYAGGGGGAGSVIAVMGQIHNNQKEVLYLVDTTRKTLAVYEFNTNALLLKAVRHYNYDVQLIEYPGTGSKPSVKDVKKMLGAGK